MLMNKSSSLGFLEHLTHLLTEYSSPKCFLMSTDYEHYGTEDCPKNKTHYEECATETAIVILHWTVF